MVIHRTPIRSRAGAMGLPKDHEAGEVVGEKQVYATVSLPRRLAKRKLRVIVQAQTLKLIEKCININVGLLVSLESSDTALKQVIVLLSDVFDFVRASFADAIQMSKDKSIDGRHACAKMHVGKTSSHC